jgi:hypothetical protein
MIYNQTIFNNKHMRGLFMWSHTCINLSNHGWTDPMLHANPDIRIFAYGEVLFGKIKEIEIGLMFGFDDLKCGIDL